MESQSADFESEEISENFQCCVCLDVLYKPVVLACGHVCCFWCVHQSMSGLRESHCPTCQHPYYHFPTICQMLHFLLLKMYPAAYKRRENQILEEEKEKGIFSPKFDDLLCASHASEELNYLDDEAQSSATSNRDNLSTNLSSTKKGEPCGNMKQSQSVTSVQDNSPTIPKEITTESVGAACTVSRKEKPQTRSDGTLQQVSIDDVLCAACKQLLFRPVVLNCGHVYCETCVIPADEAIRCQVCQSPHPWGFPKVFSDLDRFLEEQFPKEYVVRRSTIQLKEDQFQHESSPAGSEKAVKHGVHFSLPKEDHGSKVHIGVGCDSCGMYPIIGDRYKCKDCKERIGFDLCGDCYNSCSKLPGRFNQQHTPDHRFEILKSSTIRRIQNIMLRLLRGQSGDGSPAPILFSEASENPENVLPTSSSDNAQENSENSLVAPSTSSDTEEVRNDDTQPTTQ